MKRSFWSRIGFKPSHDLLVAALALALPGWIYLAAPEILKLPRDFSYSADIVSVDDFYDHEAGDFGGEQFSKTEFSYHAVSGDGDRLFVRNVFDVRTQSGEPIFKTERLYGIDAKTGKHVRGLGDRDRDGYLFAPRGLKRGQPFTYWHVNYDGPARMTYVREESLYGLKVAVYETRYEGVKIDQTKDLGFLPGVGITRGVELDPHLTLWVEPVTGRVVKHEDETVAYFYDLLTHERIEPWNRFKNTYAEETVPGIVASIRFQKYETLLVEDVVPLLLALVLLLALMRRFGVVLRFRSVLAGRLLVAGAAVLMLSLTLSGFALMRASVQRTFNENLDDEANRLDDLIQKRLDIYTNVLSGARGLFAASQSVSRPEWKAYVDSLKLRQYYPGIQGLGFAKVFPPDELDDVESEVRSEGFPDFKVVPQGDRDIYTSIIYLEPFDERNRRAFGYDMFSETNRRRAMKAAAQNGTPSVSAKVTLLQENETVVQAGFLMYLAVYRNGAETETVEQRQEALEGFVYGAFRMNDLMRAVLGDAPTNLDIEIYDGLRHDADTQMFSTAGTGDDSEEGVTFRQFRTIYVDGRPWTFEYMNKPGVKSDLLSRSLPWLALGAGTLVTLLVLVVIIAFARSRNLAVVYADKVTADLKKTVADLQKTKKAILNILEDVKEEKDKTEQVKRRLALATQGAKIGVWEWDVKNDVLLWDDRMFELYGVGKDRFGGAYETWRNGLHPDDVSEGDKAIKRALEGKEDFDTTFRIIRPDGEVRYIQARALVERAQDGTPLKMVGVNWDVTHEKIVDLEKTEFVSLAAHQLQTPVGSLNWNIEMLLDGDYGALKAPQKEVLDSMYRMNKRMRELIGSLLNVSRIDLGVFLIEPTPTDFVQVCSEVLEELSSRMAEKGVVVEKTCDTDLGLIPADPKLLRIIFQNFLSNAIKYSGPGGRVKAKMVKRGKEIEISVSNTGPGIPIEDQPKIFKKLYRASNAMKMDADGNGLGLYIVKKIAESAGGRVWFTSIPDGETTFYVSFPLTGMLRREGTRALS